jgi:peptidoglycan/xylan/chitin deacetylase (PgdA/CDA1 family)
VVVGLLLAALGAALVRALDGRGGPARTQAPAAPPTSSGSSVPVERKRHRERAKSTTATLAARGQRAVERLAEIGLPLFCGGGRGRYVALTFDDGPGPYTERYAFPLFRETKTRVTWFVVGRNIANWPTLPKLELAFGTVANHTWNHAYLPGLDLNAMKSELASTQTQLERSTGTQINLFRPPYGARNAAIDRQAQALGMLEVLWSIDSRDSAGADWRGISKEVLDNVRSGSIILFHENRGQTIRALKFHILPSLRRRHFKTVTVPELLALDPPTRKQLQAGGGGC